MLVHLWLMLLHTHQRSATRLYMIVLDHIRHWRDRLNLGHWICMAEFKISSNLNNQMNTINKTRHMAVILTTNTFFTVRILMYLTQYLLYLT